MNRDCLDHKLSQDERAFFLANGYLVVPDALTASQVNRLIAVVDRIDTRERNADHQGKLLSVSNVIHEDDAMVDLVTQATVLPKVWDILGWNIYLYHSHIDVTPSENADRQNWSVAWHQDSMRVNDEIESNPRPRLSLKVGYYLTDVSEAHHGNTLILPGSHLQNELDCPQDGRSNPTGAEPVCVTPGSALIIDRRIWHSRSANTSGMTRKVIWYGYSYRWMRPKDAMTVTHLYPKLDAIQRQLLGDKTSANGMYDPTEEDVPLRSWLREHDPSAATGSPHGHAEARPPAMVRGRNSGRN
ncbi:MAG: phytanoyl-CoA dioxygenase family protein [Planctomycetaceae bacterium]|nr:phytanoyl-CoA dioxygenase family protein [Planctomycetales bacterium]MCB9921474.1 phytanoyl-CoA dioxygenase family protein [Planctomycetaceae bacterium]